MTPQELKLIDAALSTQLDILRHAASVEGRVLVLLEQMQRKLRTKIAAGKLTEFGKARLKALLNETDSIIKETYTQIRAKVELSLVGVTKAVVSAEDKSLQRALRALSEANAYATGETADLSRSKPFSVGLATGVLSQTALNEIVSSQLIEGAPSAAWWARQAGDTSFRFANIVRQGVATGETNEEIFRHTKDLVGLAGRNSRALVQTSVAQAASDARVALIEKNTDIYKGYRHLSTLDGHTTEVCIARSNLMWDMDGKPMGHNLPFKPPPVHWNCRSVMVGVLKTFKEMGIDIPEPEGMTRSSAEGQIDRETSFEAFLGRRTEAQQDAQLGPGRAELWREGKITLRQLVDNSGNALTLSQLRSKYE